MRKIFIICSIMSIVVGYVRAQSLEFHKYERNIQRISDESECYQTSYAAISDSALASWTRIFVQEGIDNNPFAMMIYLIGHFSNMEQVRHDDCMSLDDISSSGQTNVRSSVIATCALVRKLGWDLQCLYNKNDVYLGICFSREWEIMEGLGTENDGRIYFVKEFDTYSPAGISKQKNPALCQSITVSEAGLKPFPLVTTLPWFEGEYHERRLKWDYEGTAYTHTVRILKQQIEWAENLPRSVCGMAASGMLELHNIGLSNDLQQLVRGLNEYERVNFLLRFCQSEGVFRYEQDEPIKSVSRQLQEARNDCDGRSIFLYCLLRTVLDYTEDEVVFVMWPDQLHLTLSVRPRTEDALEILKKRGYCTHDDFYVLDPAYMGDTDWGSKMKQLSDKIEIITK